MFDNVTHLRTVRKHTPVTLTVKQFKTVWGDSNLKNHPKTIEVWGIYGYVGTWEKLNFGKRRPSL